MKDFLLLVFEPLRDVVLQFWKYLPNIFAMLIILIGGILFARFLRFLMLRLLHSVNFDSWSDRMGITAILRKGDLWSKPSVAVGAGLFWIIIIMSLMAALSALRLDPINRLVAQFILYIPRALSALLILVVGYVVAGFVGRAVLITAVNSGYRYARLVAEAVKLLLSVLVFSMVLEQLQVAPTIVTAAFSIIFGGIVLALAISFGVGGIESAKKMIEREAADEQRAGGGMEHL